METPTRYDLNAAIENWRAELAAQPNLTTEVRRELETHLRDAIAGFQQRGLSDEESFWLACKRVGQPPQLGEEFVKVDPTAIWRGRVFWMSLAVLVVWLWNASFSLTGGIASNLFINFLTANNVEPSTFWWLVSSPWSVSRVVIILIRVLPVCGLTFFLAKGQLNINSALLSLFCSRLRLATLVGVWSFINAGIFAWLGWQAAKYAPANQIAIGATKTTDVYSVWQSLFYNLSFPLALLVLLVWLMPTQNRKTPKRA